MHLNPKNGEEAKKALAYLMQQRSRIPQGLYHQLFKKYYLFVNQK